MELAAMVCLPSPPLYPFISLYLPTPAIARKSVSLPAQIFSNIILQLRSIGGLPNQDLLFFGVLAPEFVNMYTTFSK